MRKFLFGLLVSTLFADVPCCSAAPGRCRPKTRSADQRRRTACPRRVATYVQSHPQLSAGRSCRTQALPIRTPGRPRTPIPFPACWLWSPVAHRCRTGLFYDVSYDRDVFDPTNTTCSGTPGNTIVFDETIDVYNAAGCFAGCHRSRPVAAGLDETAIVCRVCPHKPSQQHHLRSVKLRRTHGVGRQASRL